MLNVTLKGRFHPKYQNNISYMYLWWNLTEVADRSGYTCPGFDISPSRMEVNRISHVVKYPQKTLSAAFMGIILKYKQNSVHSVDYFLFFLLIIFSYFF